MRKGEVIVEVDTAKAVQEVEALVGGRLLRMLAAEGATVQVNTEIAEIEESA